MVRPGGEKCGEIAAAGAHFEHTLVFLHRQFLQNARLHLGLHHAFALVCALVQGNFQVRESKRPVLDGDKLLATHHVQEVEHVLVEDLPGADLLLDHVEAGLLDAHGTGSRERRRF